MQFTALLASAMLLVAPVLGHAGGHSPEDLVKRNAVWAASKRSLAGCSSELSERAIARRAEVATKLRQKRGLDLNKRYLSRRDNWDTVSNTNHSSSLAITSYNADPAILFGGNVSCVLAPEVTQGPYYVIGENIRHDVREDQEGVDVFLDMQFIDTNTCEPVTGIYMDIWHANATGVYSGINESGNGNSDDLTNLDKTFLRGIWKTDDEGVVQFQTIFPGHYNGRATHIHVVAHAGGYVALNGTFHGGNITHVGQFFMDEDLRSAVEAVEPYVSNTQAVTSNDDDQWASSAAGDESYDPFLNYVYLGDSVEDGLLMWVEVGIDSTANYNDDVDYAASWTEEGGVTNDEFSLGGGSGGGEGGNGTMPSGGMPSGTGGAMPSGTIAAPGRR